MFEYCTQSELLYISFLNNQQDTLIIQIYFVIKLQAVMMERSSILTLLGNSHQKPA